MLDRLFVYGSLLSSIAHPMGERLRTEAELIGHARLPGRLYRVSWYPGAVLSGIAGDQVEGELYRLYQPAAALDWLDAYESITPGPTGVAQSDEYERIVTSVTGADGKPIDAWFYRYRLDVQRLVRVTDGRWTG